ncbi:MAG: hypothetical protein K8S22_07315 [Betaproteobacteria bacterium]|nr:hypothetical protein [Betaproteobacteria bacterium]
MRPFFSAIRPGVRFGRLSKSIAAVRLAVYFLGARKSWRAKNGTCKVKIFCAWRENFFRQQRKNIGTVGRADAFLNAAIAKFICALLTTLNENNRT